MISNVNSLIFGKLLRYGKTRAPPAKISSVEMLSPIFNKTGNSKSFGIGSISGIDTMFGPFSSSTVLDTSGGGGASRARLMSTSYSGSLIFGYFMSSVFGFVITPVNADAAAVSGLHK